MKMLELPAGLDQSGRFSACLLVFVNHAVSIIYKISSILINFRAINIRTVNTWEKRAFSGRARPGRADMVLR